WIVGGSGNQTAVTRSGIGCVERTRCPGFVEANVGVVDSWIAGPEFEHTDEAGFRHRKGNDENAEDGDTLRLSRGRPRHRQGDVRRTQPPAAGWLRGRRGW